jgi:hypothetical protein
MRALTFAALCLVCCQPIVIGTPGGSGGDDTTEGSGGSPSGGKSTNGPSGGSGSVIANPTTNTGGVGGGAGTTSNGGSGGSGGNVGGAGATAGGTAAAGEAGNAGEAGSNAGANGAGGSETPGEPLAPPLTARVLLVAYDPPINAEGEPSETLTESLGLAAPNLLAQELGARLEAASGGHVHFSVDTPGVKLTFPPTENGVRYTAATYAACLANASDCQGAPADYYAIDNEQEICNLARKQAFDQVWLLGGKHFGFTIGKQLYCQVTENNGPVTRQLDVVSLDYSDGMASLLAGYQAHSQFALTEAFGVPAAIATADSPHNTYGLFVQAQGRDWNAPASGCGDLTFAPNSLSANRFDDERSAPSYCDTFLRSPRPAPLGSLGPVTCTAWGCTELGFRDYWFAHLPRAPWSDAYDQLNDFWPYIVHAAARKTPPEVSVTCSSSYEPGWCGNVIDGVHEKCNENEWAVQTGPTGFVELRFVPPKLVSGVILVDRRCPSEQVQAGHLEFSDGSEPLGFGELPDSGESAITVPFAPKLLTGLRVVIDFGSGPHPGFAEIALLSD